jgi:hypothetical protein
MGFGSKLIKLQYAHKRVTFMTERRLGPRVCIPYPGRLRGIDSEGRQFKEETVLSNLSAGGLYLRSNRKVREGDTVSVAVRLSVGSVEGTSVLHLAAQGVVLRAESQSDGQLGIAVEFKRKRIL